MLEIRSKLAARRDAHELEVHGRLQLPFDQRQKSRFRAKLVSGEEVALVLPRGAVLRGGDLVLASDGRLVEVIAEPEAVLHVECGTPTELAKAAYHLGNRHVPVQMGEGWLRIGADHVLAEMLRGLGASVVPMQAPFEPEAGAYSGGHRHHAADEGGARIHEYGDHGHDDHDHEHDHDADHDHPHGPHE